MSVRAMVWARDIAARIDVPPAERLLLLVIATYHHDKTGECFPSYDTLAENTGWKRRAVILMTGRLEANGLLFRQQRRVGGHQGSNNFVLFGRPAGNKWQASRVHKKAPCESARGCTLPRVHGDAPDREVITTKGAGPGPTALKIIRGGLK